jgi:V/A-type H+-transporting ATPase subunit I
VESGLGTYAIQAFFELFETAISFLSNSLSYVRVGAFAVAHAGLSGVIFILAEMVSPGKGIGYWIVVALGNLFIVGFEGLIVGIQTMRLEYYEFFSKFFTGGGMRYEPIALRPDVRE